LDISSASMYSVNSYLKNMDMQNKWEQKQRTGNYKADGIKTASEWVEKQKDTFKKKEQEREKAKDSDSVLDSIKNKAARGGMLTASELKYLRSKDETAYQRALAAENERKIYEHELRMCRTKEDVQRYKMHHAAYSADRVKSAMTDASMSEDDKLGAVMGEFQRMSAVNKAERDFIRSGEYSRLPSQAEKLKAERDLRRAQKEESRAAAEKRAEKKAEAAERAEKTKQKRKEQKAKAEGKKVKGLSKKRRKFRAKKAKYTTAQAQNTNEARKVRRANAKADYEQTRAYMARAAISGNTDSTSKRLDVTA
ncbi:MAG: hypothetical protein K2J72_02855, partial [Oscillospiraceae bacterium]|nr:hypothetical protein [Oscillospiraceae bacterium]